MRGGGGEGGGGGRGEGGMVIIAGYIDFDAELKISTPSMLINNFRVSL